MVEIDQESRSINNFNALLALLLELGNYIFMFI